MTLHLHIKKLLFFAVFFSVVSCRHVDEFPYNDSDYGYDTEFDSETDNQIETDSTDSSGIDSDSNIIIDTDTFLDSDSNTDYWKNLKCPGFQDKITDCNIAGEGMFNCSQWGTKSDDSCIALCIMDAECSDINQIYCDGALPDNFKNCVLTCYAKPENQFICFDGSQSIPSDWVCDGEYDCPDNSDEMNCLVDMFDCSDGNVSIPLTQVCDNTDDCPDQSDEYQCASIMCFDLN